MTIGTVYCTACEEAARDKDSGYWQARFNTLFAASLNLLPDIEMQHTTEESMSWCKLMWELCRDQNIPNRRGYAR